MCQFCFDCSGCRRRCLSCSSISSMEQNCEREKAAPRSSFACFAGRGDGSQHRRSRSCFGGAKCAALGWRDGPEAGQPMQVGGGENPTYDVWVTAEDEEGASHTLIPFGPALASVAEENFAFASAASDMEAFPSMEGGPAEAAGLEGRVGKMESALGADPRTSSAWAGSFKCSSNSEACFASHGADTGAFSGEADGDQRSGPDSCLFSLQAGIPEEQLVTLSGLLKKTSKMEDVPRQKPSRGVLSESEDEEEEPELVGEESTPTRSAGSLIQPLPRQLCSSPRSLDLWLPRRPSRKTWTPC